MTDLSNLRVAVYARFSTDKQNANSCADQIDKAARFVELHLGRVDPTLIFRDEAISGAVRERPGLMALIEACDRRRVDVVVVEAMDRLSRDTEDSAWIRRRLPRLIAIDNGIDTQSEGAAFTADIFAAVAAQLRRDVAKKTLRGMKGRAKSGKATGGALPYGYRSVPGPNGHEILIDDETAPRVVEIFAAYASGLSLSSVAAMLNERGVPPPRASRRRERNAWGVSTVRSILHNPKYRGDWTFGRREWKRDPDTRQRVPTMRDEPLVSDHRPELAIIDEEMAAVVVARFERTAKTFGRKGRRVPKPSRRHYPLSGLLRCAECGALMTIGGGAEGRRYYVCNGSKRGACTLGRYILEATVRERVIAKIRDLFASPAAHQLSREAVADVMSQADFRTQRRRELVDRIEKGEARSERLALLIADGEAPDALMATLRKVESQLRSDRAALERLDSTPTPPRSAPSPAEVLEGIASALQGPVDVVREQLRTLLDGERLDVVQHADGAVSVRGALDLGQILGPKTKKAPTVSDGCSYVDCGGRI